MMKLKMCGSFLTEVVGVPDIDWNSDWSEDKDMLWCFLQGMEADTKTRLYSIACNNEVI